MWIPARWISRIKRVFSSILFENTSSIFKRIQSYCKQRLIRISLLPEAVPIWRKFESFKPISGKRYNSALTTFPPWLDSNLFTPYNLLIIRRKIIHITLFTRISLKYVYQFVGNSGLKFLLFAYFSKYFLLFLSSR